MKTYHPFQLEDITRMRVLGNSVNGSEAGVGKTAIAVGLIENRTLIVVPKSVLYQAQSEILAFRQDITPIVATGTPKTRKVCYKAENSVLLLTYETLRIDIQAIALLPVFDTIIFDEMHRLANHQTKTHKAIRNLLSYYKRQGYATPRIYGFTASLIMNSPMDIFGVYNILQPHLFPNWFHFVNKYMVRTSQGWLIGARRSMLPDLGQIIKPYFIKRTLAEVAPQLPPHIDEIIKFDLSVAERRLYDDIRKEILLEIDPLFIDKVKNPMSLQNALTKLLKLCELTDSADLIGHSGIKSSKLEVLKEKLDELLIGNNRKCVVFSRFARMMPVLSQLLREYNPTIIQGSVSGPDRQTLITKFKTDPATRVMLMTTAGSEGISLEEASYLIRLDTPFSIGRDIQLTGRIRRITSVEPTFSYTLCSKGTVDEKMLKILERKQLMNATVFDWSDLKEMLE